MKTQYRIATCAAAVVMAWCTFAPAQVLDQVPSNAMAVFKVNSLSATNAKLIKLSTAFGLDQMMPDFKDPLAAFLEKTHMSAGVDKEGEMALAVFDGQSAGIPQDEAMVAVIPVSDYQAFVGNFKDAKEDGDLTSATSPDDGKPVSIAHWGKYAAVSPGKSLLAKKPTGFKVAGMAQKEATSKDITLIANMAEVRRVALPQFKEQRQKMVDEVTKNLGQDENAQKFAPVMKAMINVYLDGVQGFLEQATNGVVGFGFADDGISTSAVAEFPATSSFGKTFASLHDNNDAGLLAGLPDRKYFLFGGYAGDPGAMKTIVTNIIDPIEAELKKSGAEGEKLATALDAMKAAASSIRSSAAGYVQPSGALGQESIIQAVAYASGDAHAIQAAERSAMQGVGDMMKEGLTKQAQMDFVFKAAAKTVDGVSLDQYEIKVSGDQNDPKAAQAQQAIAMIYGPNGLSGLWGSVDEKTFIVAQGAPDALLSDLIAAAKAPKDVLSNRPGVRLVASHLPKQRIAEYYVALDNIVSSAARYAAGFGFAVKFHLPPNLPPVGIAVATDGPSIRVDSFIPSELVQNMISAGLQVQQNMQGGAGAGGAGGPGGL